MTATFPAVAMPFLVCVALFEAIEAGKLPADLCVYWRERDAGGAVVCLKAEVAGRLRRAGHSVWSRKILVAKVPAGKCLVFVELRAGRNLTYATLPTRLAPVVVTLPGPKPLRAKDDAHAVLVAPAPRVLKAVKGDADAVIVRPAPRAVPRTDRARAQGRYAEELDRVRARPGIPRGKATP